MEIPTPSSLFTFLGAALILIITAVSAVDPVTEALLSLKSEIVYNSNSLSDWLMPSGANPSDKIFACSWTGVTCNKNSTIVTGLDLSMKNLAGSLSGNQFNALRGLVDLNLSHNSFSEKLPVSTFNLTTLRTLDISRNNFSSHFPAGISNLRRLVVLDAFSNSFSGPLPAELPNLEFLRVLNLAGSYFTGPIPPEYGSFPALEFIHLAGNLLTGDIPPELGRLKTVTHMEIGYNSYQGTIPWQFGNMSQLKYLDIAGANLSGGIPSQLSNLTKLHSLFLFRNQLTGLLPWEFGKIETLTSVDLSDNQLAGPIPETFAELKNLRLLSLMYNNLNGTLPELIAQLPSLDALLIWNNFFHGSLPESLGRHSNLKWVDVSTNNFVDGIPPEICSGGSLSKLILFSNSFSGGIPRSLISKCSSLVRLRIENNKFSGEIPLKFSNLPDINYVDLSRNRFTGGIPSDLPQASKLQHFNVSNNPELGGVIPAKTWSLPLLQNFSASSCNITSDLPPFQLCKSLSVIELSKNKMSGNIPLTISNCQVLERMELSDNNFTGHLPEELATLPAVSILDFSLNDFDGQIPTNFENSSTLLLLNVSFNRLSGTIPPGKTFMTMGRSVFVGNPELCGPPLQSCHGKIHNGFQLGIRRTQKLAWVMIICAVVVLCVTVSAIAIIYFRKGREEKWEMVSFAGLTQVTANDVLMSLNSAETVEAMPLSSDSDQKAVLRLLPTGNSVSVKKIEVDSKNMKDVFDFITRLGNARHENLVRLLGFCYNKHFAYVLYDCLPNGNLAEMIQTKRDWVAKHKIVIGIARGLHFLHHECYPAIPHGDLKASNVVFGEDMEPHLAEFGFKFLIRGNDSPFMVATSSAKTGEANNATKEELYMDVYSFGEIILEVLTNGRLTNAGERIHGKPIETLLREIYHENEVGSSDSFEEEIKMVLEVVLLCTRSRPSDRPSIEDVLKLLSTGLKPKTK